MSERFSLADPDERAGGLEAAEDALRAGKLVVLPTDTVYGVAADAFTPAAVRRLLRAKGRGRNMPPPVLVGARTTLDAVAINVPMYAKELIADLWPGPLTLVCRQQPSLNWDLGDNHETVAVRMPDYPDVLELIERTGPLACSSANRSRKPAATTVDEAADMLGESIAVYLDGGPTPGSAASTILDVTDSSGRLLREGPVSLERLQEYDEHIEGPQDSDA